MTAHQGFIRCGLYTQSKRRGWGGDQPPQFFRLLVLTSYWVCNRRGVAVPPQQFQPIFVLA